MSPRLAFILAAAIALVAIGGWISRSVWKPALDRAVAAAFDAQDDADARAREAEGNAQTTADIATWSDQRSQGRAATHALEFQNRDDPDAQTPLSADRRARLSEHDGRMCALRPEVCGHPGPGTTAPVPDPRLGSHPLSAAAPAG